MANEIPKSWHDQTAGRSYFEGLNFQSDRYWKTCRIQLKSTKGKTAFEGLSIKIGSSEYKPGSFTLDENKTKEISYTVNDSCNISVNGYISRPMSNLKGAGGKVTVTCEYYPDLNSVDWMKILDSNLKISRISVPGTHETCALHGGVWVECQKWDIPTQLEKGLRFLDIRCRHFKDRFEIHHGLVYQKINFDKVIDQCESFLKSHPSECILMSIKEEYDAAENSRTFVETFDWYIQNRPAKLWYLHNKLPELKDARGRIVVLRRFSANSNQERGLNVSGWKDNCTFTITLPAGESVNVQDVYKYDTIYGKTNKWNAIKNLLDKASGNSSGQTLYWNFSSATGLSKGNIINTPKHVANDINPLLEDYFTRNPKVKSGIIAMDFPQEELINKVLLSNY